MKRAMNIKHSFLSLKWTWIYRYMQIMGTDDLCRRGGEGGGKGKEGEGRGEGRGRKGRGGEGRGG